MNTYCLSVTSAEGNEIAMFPCVRSDGRSVHLLVEKHEAEHILQFVFYI